VILFGLFVYCECCKWGSHHVAVEAIIVSNGGERRYFGQKRLPENLTEAQALIRL
jgi:hypothetical protein